MMPIGRSTASASSQSRAVVETGSSCQCGCSCMATAAQDGARDTQRGRQCGRRDQDLGWFHQQVGKAMFDQSGDVQHGESPDSVGAQCASCAWIHSATSPISAGSTWPGCLYCASPDSPSTAMPRWLSGGYSLNSTSGSSWKPAFQRGQSASPTWMSSVRSAWGCDGKEWARPVITRGSRNN